MRRQVPAWAGRRKGPRRSIRVSASKYVSDRERENAQVEPHRPVIDVIQVVLYPLAQVAAPAQIVDLRPARDPSFYHVLLHVARDLLAEARDELGPFGARPDKRHLAPEHVEKLRKLVEAQPAQQSAEPCGSRIVLARPHRAARVLGADGHRAELEHREATPVPRHPLLTIEHRARRGELDRDRDHEKKGSREQQREPAERVVLRGLEDALHAFERRIGQADHGHASDFRKTVTKQLKAENVRHVPHLHGKRAKLADEVPDALLVAQRQRDPDLIELAPLEIAAKLGHITQHRDAIDDAARELGRIVVEAAQVQSGPRGAAQTQDDFLPELACADDAYMPQVVAAAAQEAKRETQRQSYRRLQQEASGKPQCHPDARIQLSGLGYKNQKDPEREQRKPTVGERTQVLDQASTALRAIQSRRGKDGEAHERDRKHRDPIRGRRIGRAEIDPLHCPSDSDDDDRIGKAEQLIQRGRVGFEQTAATTQHGVDARARLTWNSASAVAISSAKRRRNVSAAKRSALARQASALMRSLEASNAATAVRSDAALCALKNTPVGASLSSPRIVSDAPPRPNAITGVPQACASSGAMPKSSSAAKMNAEAPRNRSRSRWRDTSPVKSTLVPAAARALRSPGPSPTTISRRPGIAWKAST